MAPVVSDDELATNGAWWVGTCMLDVIPIAAVLHHAVCYPQCCMLQPFSMSYEVTGPVLWRWLTHDPSLPWAIIAAFIVYRVGRRIHGLKILVAPLFLSFLLVSLWVWDLLVLGRPICRGFHDGRYELWEDFPVRGWHFYVFGICIHIAFTVYLLLLYYRSAPAEGRKL